MEQKENEDLYRQVEASTNMLCKRKLKHAGGTPQELTAKIISYITKVKRTKKSVEETLVKVGISLQQAWNKEVYQINVDKFKRFQKNPSEYANSSTWSEEMGPRQKNKEILGAEISFN